MVIGAMAGAVVIKTMLKGGGGGNIWLCVCFFLI
jgi:hypothetical protein